MLPSARGGIRTTEDDGLNEHSDAAMPRSGARHILIAGGGASGVLVAVHLLKSATPMTVTLVERRCDLGAGIAYGTAHPAHLLNVRAAGMSAFPDDPDHFWRWAAAQNPGQAGVPADAHDFAARRLYRSYLDSLLDPYRAGADGAGRFRVVTGDIVRCVPGPHSTDLHLSDGRLLSGDVLVLATGNEGPPLPPASWRRDGWSGDAAPPPPDSRVLIVGAGLTMVDQVQSLLHGGHRGPITALSRHGLTPHPHRPVTPLPVAREDFPAGAGVAAHLRTLRQLVRAAQAQGHDWRSVIDGLRPHTAAIWQGFDIHRKRRFLRHARAFWDTYRHRIAPQAHERLHQAMLAGQLQVLAGKIERFEPGEGGVVVDYRERGTRLPRSLEADIIYECRGRATRIVQTVNPLLRHMLDTGRVIPDETGLGLAVTPDLAIIEGSGAPSRRIFALGPLTAGVFWESTAVPDIRQQAARLATALAG